MLESSHLLGAALGILVLVSLMALGRRLCAAKPSVAGDHPAAAPSAPQEAIVVGPRLTVTRADLAQALAMLVGICAKELWDAVNTGHPGLDWARLLGALVVSPVVYASIYRDLSHRRRPSLFGLAVAFQNGFFWQAVFSTAEGAPANPSS